MSTFTIAGNIVNITAKHIFYGEILVENGKIITITPVNNSSAAEAGQCFILPGFIDSHVHIESSMLVPAEFAKLAVVHGTVGTISDPHEIANVCGMAGVEFMIDNGKTVPFKFHFGAPSCVPATIFETAGAALHSTEVDALLQRNDIYYLSEMMNFPGVLYGDEEVYRKIELAKKYGKPVDGHAPGLRGAAAKKYIDAGISTDHECFTAEEALDKLTGGMKILIREGSAAKNFDALVGLLHDHADNMMFCSDDKHPDSLALGHINQLCKNAVACGIDVFKVLQAACINPVQHYNMHVGLLNEGDAADFIVVEDLVNFNVLKTFVDGLLVADHGRSLIAGSRSPLLNNFACTEKTIADFRFGLSDFGDTVYAIEALDGQLITNKIICTPNVQAGFYESSPSDDILKIVVVNRYQQALVAKGFVKNFGIKKGAIASSVAHDSHNLVAVGVDDESLMKAVNLVIQQRGGISAVADNKEMILSLPVAGLMSNDDGYQVAATYTAIDKMAKEYMGSTLSAPFMTLSFMALLVIPHIKLSDIGLFDGDQFAFIQ